MIGYDNHGVIPQKKRHIETAEPHEILNYVTTVAQSRKTEFNCSGTEWKKLDVRSLPSDLWACQHLHRLNLSNNLLTTVPEGIVALTQLTTLELSNNHLTALPDQIGKLENLEVLLLSSNQLPDLPDGLWSLKNLRVLNLNNNRLAHLSPAVKNARHLRLLHLCFNRLQALPPALATLSLTNFDARDNPCLPEAFQKLNLASFPAVRQLLLSALPQEKQENESVALETEMETVPTPMCSRSASSLDLPQLTSRLCVQLSEIDKANPLSSALQIFTRFSEQEHQGEEEQQQQQGMDALAQERSFQENNQQVEELNDTTKNTGPQGHITQQLNRVSYFLRQLEEPQEVVEQMHQQQEQCQPLPCFETRSFDAQSFGQSFETQSLDHSTELMNFQHQFDSSQFQQRAFVYQPNEALEKPVWPTHEAPLGFGLSLHQEENRSVNKTNFQSCNTDFNYFDNRMETDAMSERLPRTYEYCAKPAGQGQRRSKSKRAHLLSQSLPPSAYAEAIPFCHTGIYAPLSSSLEHISRTPDQRLSCSLDQVRIPSFEMSSSLSFSSTGQPQNRWLNTVVGPSRIPQGSPDQTSPRFVSSDHSSSVAPAVHDECPALPTFSAMFAQVSYPAPTSTPSQFCPPPRLFENAFH